MNPAILAYRQRREQIQALIRISRAILEGMKKEDPTTLEPLFQEREETLARIDALPLPEEDSASPEVLQIREECIALLHECQTTTHDILSALRQSQGDTLREMDRLPPRRSEEKPVKSSIHFTA